MQGVDEGNAKLKGLENTGEKLAHTLGSINLFAGIEAGLNVLDHVETSLGRIGETLLDLARKGHDTGRALAGLTFGLGAGGAGDIKEFAEQMERLAGVTRGPFLEALEKVRLKTNASAEELKLAGKAIIGLAGDTQNYDAAATKVISTMNRSDKQLKALGETIDENADGHERLAALVLATNEAFNAQIAKAQNVTDQVEIMHDQWENVITDIGVLIDQSPPLVTALSGLNEIVADIVGNLAEWIAANPVLIDQIGKDLASVLILGAKAAVSLGQGLNYAAAAMDWTQQSHHFMKDPFVTSLGPVGWALGIGADEYWMSDADRAAQQNRSKIHGDIAKGLGGLQDDLSALQGRIFSGDYTKVGPGSRKRFGGGVSGKGQGAGRGAGSGSHEITNKDLHDYVMSHPGEFPNLVTDGGAIGPGIAQIYDLDRVTQDAALAYVGAALDVRVEGILKLLSFPGKQGFAIGNSFVARNGIIAGGNGQYMSVLGGDPHGWMGGDMAFGRPLGLMPGDDIDSFDASMGFGGGFTSARNRLDPNMGRRMRGHHQNQWGYAQAAMNGDISGLLGAAGSVYGPGWGAAAGLAGGLAKKGFEAIGDFLGIGGHHHPPEVIAGKLQVHDADVLAQLRSQSDQLAAITVELQLRGAGIGIDSALGDIATQNRRAGLEPQDLRQVTG